MYHNLMYLSKLKKLMPPPTFKELEAPALFGRLKIQKTILFGSYRQIINKTHRCVGLSDVPSPIHHTDISHIRRGSLNFCDETSTDLSLMAATPDPWMCQSADAAPDLVASSSFELQPSTHSKIGTLVSLIAVGYGISVGR